MKYARLLVLTIFVGCTESPDSDEREIIPEEPTPPSNNECEGVDTPEPCTRPDSLAGHCAYDMCVISCDDASDCPESVCRTGLCISGMCQYLGNVDGSSCEISGKPGTCKFYVCAVQP
jgi:hypothetical protein